MLLPLLMLRRRTLSGSLLCSRPWGGWVRSTELEASLGCISRPLQEAERLPAIQQPLPALRQRRHSTFSPKVTTLLISNNANLYRLPSNLHIRGSLQWLPFMSELLHSVFSASLPPAVADNRSPPHAVCEILLYVYTQFVLHLTAPGSLPIWRNINNNAVNLVPHVFWCVSMCSLRAQTCVQNFWSWPGSFPRQCWRDLQTAWARLPSQQQPLSSTCFTSSPRPFFKPTAKQDGSVLWILVFSNGSKRSRSYFFFLFLGSWNFSLSISTQIFCPA